jgi:hypothetical protein
MGEVRRNRIRQGDHRVSLLNGKMAKRPTWDWLDLRDGLDPVKPGLASQVNALPISGLVEELAKFRFGLRNGERFEHALIVDRKTDPFKVGQAQFARNRPSGADGVKIAGAQAPAKKGTQYQSFFTA